MTKTLVLLLLDNAPASVETLLPARSCPVDIRLRAGTSLGDGFLDGTAHGEVLGERCRFDAYVLLEGDDIAPMGELLGDIRQLLL